METSDFGLDIPTVLFIDVSCILTPSKFFIYQQSHSAQHTESTHTHIHTHTHTTMDLIQHAATPPHNP